MCKKERRFKEINKVISEKKIKKFGKKKSKVINGEVRKIRRRKGNIENLCGKYRGIKGKNN
jgi:hypothetical protein